MAKEKKTRRGPLNPEDVIAGRARPDARELITLIREVNPTGLKLDRRETARRYALKSRLQSVLVTRFRDAIDVHPEPDEPGVVLLHHRPSGLDACHALIAELDDDARSFVQHEVDTQQTRATPNEALALGRAGPRDDARARREDESSGAPDAPDLLRAAEEALAAYDYELARSHLEAAFAQSRGGIPAAVALLSLLCVELGIDDEALALEETLPTETQGDVEVRSLLALAAARLSQRERALRLLPTTKARPARVAEVFVALARAALAEARLTEAADDLARAREHDPTHPELVGLTDALAKARAATRGPAEAEITELFAAGDVEGADERARALLERHPESEIARRILRSIEEQRKLCEARRKLDEALEALDQEATARAAALVSAAKALGLPNEEAAPAERRVAEQMETARAREDHARLAAIADDLRAGALAEGLSAYAALPATERRAVAERAPSKLLVFLDAIAPPGEATKIKPAVSAILALHRAAELAERTPEAAIALLDAHPKFLLGFGPAEEVRALAQSTLVEERRRAARSRVEAARRLMDAGNLAQASKMLGEVPPKDLQEEELAAIERLRAELQQSLERSTLAAALDQHRREGDVLRALSACEALAARSKGEEAARIASLRAELRADVRRAFSVQIEDFEEGSATEGIHATLHDARIMPRWRWMTMLSRARGEREEDLLLVPQTKSVWVFVRVFDVETGALRTRVRLRSPCPIDLQTAALRGRHLLIVGQHGSLIEIDTDDWTVLRFCRNVLGNGDAVLSKIELAEVPEVALPEVIVESAMITAEGRYLWMNTMSGDRERTRRHLSIFDLDDLRQIRAIREHRSARVSAESVHGLTSPRVVVIESDDEGEDEDRTTFYGPRGTPSGEPTLDEALMHHALVASPDGAHIVGVMGDPSGPKDPHTARWGFFEMDERGAGPLHLFEGVTAVHEVTAMGSLDARMCFVLFDVKRGGPVLFGVRWGDEGPSIAFRTRVPQRSLLAGTTDGRRAALITLRGDQYAILPLGPEPPKDLEGDGDVRFRLPCTPQGSVHTKHFDCHEPTGTSLAEAMAVEAQLRREGKQGITRRMALSRRKFGPDEILAFEHALIRLGESALAGHVNAIGYERFPDHPTMRLLHARTLGSVRRWREALTLLGNDDDARFRERAEIKHYRHMRGIALMMLDQPEAALVELERSAACEEGPCNPEELIPLCAPLSDEERSWSPEQAITREYLRVVSAADEALARGDAASARRILDCALIWEAYELQSMARLAEACLRAEEEGAPRDRFHEALIALSFCDLFDARHTMNRREMPLPRATWDEERLSALEGEARGFAERALKFPSGAA